MKTWVTGVCAALCAATGAAAEPAGEPPLPAAAPGVISAGSPALGAPGGLAGAAAAPQSPIELSAYFILGGNWMQSDPNQLAVGRTNGFQLADARIELTGRPAENLWLYLSIDGAVAPAVSDQSNLLAVTRTVSLKDAYGVWAPIPHLRVQAGQFKAPQNLESLLEETELKFASRSVVTQGVQPPVGLTQQGLALDRQLGVGLGTDHVVLGPIGLTAQVALTNGNGPNQYVNDTQTPTVSGRLALDFAFLSVGVDGYYNPRALGTQPNLQRENSIGFGGDVRAEWRNLHLLGLVQYRSTQHVTTGYADSTALGLSGEVAYRIWFLEPAVRVATYNPDNTITAPDGSSLATVTWFTFGLNLYAPGAGSARLKLDYTHRVEAAGRSLDNDGLDLALQVRF